MQNKQPFLGTKSSASNCAIALLLAKRSLFLQIRNVRVLLPENGSLSSVVLQLVHAFSGKMRRSIYCEEH